MQCQTSGRGQVVERCGSALPKPNAKRFRFFSHTWPTAYLFSLLGAVRALRYVRVVRDRVPSFGRAHPQVRETRSSPYRGARRFKESGAEIHHKIKRLDGSDPAFLGPEN